MKLILALCGPQDLFVTAAAIETAVIKHCPTPK